MALLGRTIAIAGTGRGLGRALAIVSADRGAIPILLGRSPEHLAAVRQAIGERVNLFPDALRCDLADFASIADAAERFARHHPDLDVLVHNGSPRSGAPSGGWHRS